MEDFAVEEIVYIVFVLCTTITTKKAVLGTAYTLKISAFYNSEQVNVYSKLEFSCL